MCEKYHETTSTKIRVLEKTVLPPGSQNWVVVTSQRHGVMLLLPDDALYANHHIAPTNGVVQTTPSVPYRILVANLGKHPKILVKNQVIGSLFPHPVAMYLSKVMLADMLGVPKPSTKKTTSLTAIQTPQTEVPDLRRSRQRRPTNWTLHTYRNHTVRSSATCSGNTPLCGTAPWEKSIHCGIYA